MNQPHLVIGGASKCGTTALYYYLRQHPGICLSEKKELHYFSRPSLERTIAGPGDRFVLSEIPKTLDEYLSFFGHCGSGKVAVDISPSYLYYHESAYRIKDQLGDVRVVFILRHPVDKAFSQYIHLVGEGRETLGFEDALAKETERQQRGYSDMWLYKTSGYYSDALEYYISVMGRENLRIFYYDEFLRSPEYVLCEICAFADVDASFRFTPVSDINRSGRPNSAVVAKILKPSAFTFLLRRIVPLSLGRPLRKLIKDWNTGEKPILAENVRKLLLDSYRPDIRRLEALIGRESGWLDTA